MSDTIPYAAEPNRVLSTGAVSLDAVGLSFSARQDRIVIEARTGQIDERTITLPYDEVQRVSVVDGVAPGIEIATSQTEYEATDISPSLREVRRVVTAIRRQSPNIATERSRTDGARQNNETTTASEDDDGSQPDTATSAPAETNGNGADEDGNDDGDAIVTFAPGEVMTCPACGGKTAVPDRLPSQRQRAECPDCTETIGHVNETGDHIAVEAADPD
ncbi:hypothetical protein [Halorientalis sp.]|uniref:hypothetical protein n=1 Tax=Halorientalis sp. TaxID=1931229 RepID=UPI002632D980|nr:hypothetical protein [Halorientalis sp.]